MRADPEVLRRVHELQRRTKRGPVGPAYDVLDQEEREIHARTVARAIASYHRVAAREVPLG